MELIEAKLVYWQLAIGNRGEEMIEVLIILLLGGFRVPSIMRSCTLNLFNP